MNPADQFSATRWNLWGVLGTLVIALLVWNCVEAALFFAAAFIDPDLRTYGSLRALIAAIRNDPGNAVRIETEPYVALSLSLRVLTIGLTVVLFRRWIGVSSPRDLGFQRPTGSTVIASIFTGLMLLLASVVVLAIEWAIFHHTFHKGSLIHDKTLIGFALLFAQLVIVAPLTEELLFRGVLFTGLVQRMAPEWAALISAVAFSVVHLRPWGLISGLIVGYALAILYYRSKTLWAPIIAHGVINGTVFALILAHPT